jgi:sugar/nucleoside kinase (ribokinase family)
LARSDFPAATLAELARGRRLLLDGQGLARPARTGQVALDDDFDPALLGSLTMLKLAEDEAVALAGSAEPGAIRRLGVPEVVVTLGSRGAVVVTRRGAEQIQVRPVEGRVDPTGAGDAFAAVYLASRAAGHAPSSAGRRASALVTGLLHGRTR